MKMRDGGDGGSGGSSGSGISWRDYADSRVAALRASIDGLTQALNSMQAQIDRRFLALEEASHDLRKIHAQLAALNGLYATRGGLHDVRTSLTTLALAIQELRDQAHARDASDALIIKGLRDEADARDRTVTATAAALRDAEVARRQRSDTAWTPLARMLVILGTLGTLIGVAFGIYAYSGHPR